jgi:hypothetical protein
VTDREGSIASGRRHRGVPAWWWAAAGLAAALPTLASAAWSPTFMADDWAFAAGARSDGFVSLLQGVDIRSRPLQALFHAVTFTVLGPHPVVHLLLLALLNGLAAAAVLKVSLECFTRRVAVLVTASWVVLANHGATRLWIATGPMSLSVLFLLAASWFAVRPRPNVAAVVAFGVLSMLTYEGGAALAGGLVLVAAWRRSDRTRDRLRDIAAGGVVLVAVAVWVLVTSPKQLKGSAPFEPGRVVASGLGSALLPASLRGVSVLILVAVLISLATAAMPTFRRRESVGPLVAGLVALVLGALPVLFARYPLATSGMLGRVNVYLAFGGALLVAGTLDQLWRLPSATAAGAVSVVLLAVLAVGNVGDVRDAHQAQHDGRVALAALARWASANGGASSGGVVIAPMPPAGGWSAFGYGTVGSALRLRYGVTVPNLDDSISQEEFDTSPGLHLELEGDGYRVVCPASAPSCG